jgi:hypothetical protein
MLEHPDTVSEQLLALMERGLRARSNGLVRTRPRVRRTVTDLTKQRRVAGLRAGRRRHAS